MKIIPLTLFAAFTAFLLPLAGRAQVNSGSDGHDGALNPAVDIVINMADHPDGIYQYTSVNIPRNVTVSFVPNAGNKPVVWLVQGNCIISGYVNVAGEAIYTGQIAAAAALGGPGGFGGGLAPIQNVAPSPGKGPGGGTVDPSATRLGGNGSFGTIGTTKPLTDVGAQYAAGTSYGNGFLLPLIGGSGGGGGYNTSPSYSNRGGGGGGAILIAANGTISILGTIDASGGGGYDSGSVYILGGGGGSGGAARLVATKIDGNGKVIAPGGNANYQFAGGIYSSAAGLGRIRFDCSENSFTGSITGSFTQGFQPIIIPAPGQGVALAIQSVAGTAVPASPSGGLTTPDIIIPAQQANPIPVVVRCTNIPLSTAISVVVHPANGADVQAVGVNDTGTVVSSTATLSLNMPRGGGIIYARAVTGVVGTASIASPAGSKTPSLAETGWTAGGERFVKLEITAALGGKQSVAYITESGKRYPAN